MPARHEAVRWLVEQATVEFLDLIKKFSSPRVAYERIPKSAFSAGNTGTH